MAHPERADVRVRRSDADEPAAAVVTIADGVALSGGAVAQVLDLAVVGRQKVAVVSNPASVQKVTVSTEGSRRLRQYRGNRRQCTRVETAEQSP